MDPDDNGHRVTSGHRRALPWLYGIASNLVRRRRRAEVRQLRALERTGIESVLTAWAGLSYDELAAALDIPLGTVRSRLHRARTKVPARR